MVDRWQDPDEPLQMIAALFRAHSRIPEQHASRPWKEFVETSLGLVHIVDFLCHEDANEPSPANARMTIPKNLMCTKCMKINRTRIM